MAVSRAEPDPEPVVPVVCVVDDDPRFLLALSRLLHASGYKTELFSSAEQFLLFNQNNPGYAGCVIVDLQLPAMNGLALQESLREQQDLMPLIFLSGHADIPSSVKAMKRDAVDFLTKPVCSDDLLDAVKRALEAGTENRRARQQREEILARYERLTPREREVLALVVRGMLNKQIAFDLGTVERTVKAHRAQIMAKMQVQSLPELVRIAGRLGKIDELKTPSH